MTNSYNDIHNSAVRFSSSVVTLPKRTLFRCFTCLKAKEQNNAPVIVCDPRFHGPQRTLTNMFASARVQTLVLSGASCGIFSKMAGKTRNSSASAFGMEDVQRGKQMDPRRGRACHWCTRISAEARCPTMANNRPGTFIWCMGGTQHTNGNNNTRATVRCSWLLATWACAGGGINIFRGHDCNVQGATDLVFSRTRCPAITACRQALGSTGRVSGVKTTIGLRPASTQSPARMARIRA